MKKLLLLLLANTLAVLAGAYLLPGVHVDGFAAAVVAAVALGFVNALVRPVLVLLTLPATLLTLGLFLFVINALMVLLVDWLVPGLQVAGFLWALIYSLLVSVFASVFQSVLAR